MRRFALGLSLCLTLISGWIALTIGASEPPIRNIVYIHVPAAICSLVCFVVLFVCSIQYLRWVSISQKNREMRPRTKTQSWDYIATASAEVGLIFATVLNITGMIFAYAEWGIWWTPSPRLISSAVLWFLYAAYCLLRASFTAERPRSKTCAVFGIIAFIDVPLVLISARYIRDIHQPNVSFEVGWQYAALGLAVCAALLLAFLLVWIRADIFKINDRIQYME
jgi:heme exporter protein C